MSINLLPWREIRYQKNKKILWIEVSCCLFFVFSFILISFLKNNNILESQAKDLLILDRKIKSTAMDYAIAVSQQKQRIEEDRKEHFLKNTIELNQALFKAIDEISNRMPDTIYLTAIKRKESGVNFIGKSTSHAELAKFLEQVKAEIDQQPVMTETSRAEGQDGEIDFEVGYELLEKQ